MIRTVPLHATNYVVLQDSSTVGFHDFSPQLLPNIYFLGYLYNPTLWMGNTPFQLLYLEPLVKLYPIDIVWLNHNHSPT